MTTPDRPNIASDPAVIERAAERQCRNCEFWTGSRDGEPHAGDCHRHAPTLQRVGPASFPCTSSSWWCGEFCAALSAIPEAGEAVRAEREALDALRNLRFVRPETLDDEAQINELVRPLHMQGDVRRVYVNEGDWIMVEIAINALRFRTKDEANGKPRGHQRNGRACR